MTGTMLPGFRVDDSWSADQIRRGVLEKLSSNPSSEIGRVIGSGLRGGRSIGDAEEENIAAVFDMVHATLDQLKKGSKERNRRIGSEILGSQRPRPEYIRNARDAEDSLSGRDLWMWRISHPGSFDHNAEEL